MNYTVDITYPVRKALDAIDDEASRHRDLPPYDDKAIVELACRLTKQRQRNPHSPKVTEQSAWAVKQLLMDNFELPKEDVNEWDEFISSVIIEQLAPDIGEVIHHVLDPNQQIAGVARIHLRYSPSRKIHATVELLTREKPCPVYHQK